jgi:formiminoglutamase
MYQLNAHSYLHPSPWNEEEEIAQGRLGCHIQPLSLEELPPLLPARSIVFLGFSSDEGVRRNLGRFGAADAPEPLRKALKNLAWNEKTISLWDSGTICCHEDNLEKAQELLAGTIATLRARGAFVIVLGGGHEMAWGHFQGLVKSYSSLKTPSLDPNDPTLNIDVVNFDAHFDLRPLFPIGNGSSGTSFRQIHHYCTEKKIASRYACLGLQPLGNTANLFDYAHSINTYYTLAEEMIYRPHLVHESLGAWLAASKNIYLTLCLDVFASAYAPGVSSPQAFGLSPYTLLPFFRQVLESGKVIGFDIAELNPIYDQDSQTAKLAAHFVAEVLKNYVG